MTIPREVAWAIGATVLGAAVWIFTGAIYGIGVAVLAFAAGFLAGNANLGKAWLIKIFFLLALCLPLSVDTPMGDRLLVNVPAEIILGILALSAPLFLRKADIQELLSRHPLPALWILSFVPALVFSDMAMVSVKYTVVQACYVLVCFYLLIHIAAGRGAFMERLWVMYALALLPVGIWAGWLFAGYQYNPVTIPGIFKPFLNDHTLFGGTCAALAVAFGTLGTLRKQAGYTLAALVLIAATVFSGSRAAMLSLLVLPLVLLLGFSTFWRKLIPTAAIVLLALLAVGWTQVEDYFRENMPPPTTIGDNVVDRLKSGTNTRSDVSNLERLNRWHAALGMWRERPHHGFGPGTYQFVYVPYQSPAFENRLTVYNPERPPEGSGGTAHSELLLQLSENGWPSTLVFIALLLRYLWLFGRYGRATRPLLCAAAAGLFSYYIHMMFNNFLSTASFAFLFWSMAAAVEIHVAQIRNTHE